MNSSKCPFLRNAHLLQSGSGEAACLFDMLSVENCLSMPDPDAFHLPKVTSIGQKLAKWIEKCFQLMESPLVTKWGDLKSNLFSMENLQIVHVSTQTSYSSN